MAQITHYLDYNHRAPIGITLADGKLTLDVTEVPGFRLRQNIGKAMMIHTPDAPPQHAFSIDPADNRTLQMDGPNPAVAHVPQAGREFALSLYGEVLGKFTVDDSGDIQPVKGTHRPLTASELRRLGTFYREHGAPYSLVDTKPALIELAKKAVTTDFHTHSSGQISPEGLMDVAMKHDVYYPIRLLREMGIKREFSDDTVKTVPRIFFAALDAGKDIPKEEQAISLKALTETEQEALALKMQMPVDRQATYTEMEYDAYRFRYPLAKANAVQVDMLKKMAEEYAKQGITHAEVAYTSLHKPEVLANVHEAMAAMEKENEKAIATGEKPKYASLSFLFAIPRSMPMETIKDLLERAKILMLSPYITGIDFIGYETNKTEDLKEVLEPFLQWASSDYTPSTILRVHAGENAKNRSNVRDVLELAKQYNVRTRIGHGIYGLDDKKTLQLAKKLAEKKLLTIELNPDSNIALNNIDSFTDLPFNTLTKLQIPFVIGSDSGGTYGTDRTQLGLAGLYSGLDAHGFKALEKHQATLLAQHEDSVRHTKAILNEFLINPWESKEDVAHLVRYMTKELDTIEEPKKVPGATTHHDTTRQTLRHAGKLLTKEQAADTLAGRKPIAIVGASGTSWSRINNPEQQAQIATAIDMLVHVLNPEKAYILQGRSKDSGIGKLIHKAVDDANASQAEKPKLQTVGIIARPQYDRQAAFDNLDYLIEIEGGLIDVADNIVNHVVENAGTLVAAGGSAFTRDIILKADQRMSRQQKGALMLMATNGDRQALGASSEKARVLHPHYQVQVGHDKEKGNLDGREIIQNLYKLYPDVFVEGFKPNDKTAMDTLANESRARVEGYQLDKPSSAGQNVAEGETISPDRGIEGGK